MTTVAIPDNLDLLPNYQGQWRDFQFGEGTNYQLVDELNLLEYDSRISDQPMPMGDGDIVYGRWASGRFITLNFIIYGTPLSGELDGLIAAFLSAFAVDDPYREDWLAFSTIHRKLLVRARVVRRRVEMSAEATRSGRAHAVIELKVADPRIYFTMGSDPTNTVFIATTAYTGGGFDLDTDLGLDMTAGSGGTTVGVNDGASVAYPVIRISNEGPTDITNSVITNVTSGVVVEIDTLILAGQTLVLDFDGMVRATKGPHIHIDEADRYGDWQHPRVPLGLLPGPNTLTAVITGGTPTVRADWLESLI